MFNAILCIYITFVLFNITRKCKCVCVCILYLSKENNKEKNQHKNNLKMTSNLLSMFQFTH